MSSTLSRLSDDFVVRFSRDLYHCSSCSYCVDAVWPERGLHDACVTMAHHTRAPGYSGRGFIEAARAVLEGTALDAASLAERVHTCTSCGNCESACPIGLRPASIGEALRAELVDAGCVPDAIASARRSVLDAANPYGAERSARSDWLAEPVEPADDSGPIYFVGCAAAVARPEEARAGYELLRSAGLAPLIETSECCGAPLQAYGDHKGAEKLAAACIGPQASRGRAIIAAGYECQRQLEKAQSVTTQSLPAWLLGAVHDGDVTLTPKASAPQSVHLLEACALKRRTPDAPATDEVAARELFATLGIECTNPRYPSPHAPCCGAGGGMPVMQPEASRRMAEARIPAGEIAVTLDPRCAAHLRSVGGTDVYGFAEFVNRHFTVAPAPAGSRTS